MRARVQVTVVNFFTPSEKACLQSLPLLDRLARKWEVRTLRSAPRDPHAPAHHRPFFPPLPPSLPVRIVRRLRSHSSAACPKALSASRQLIAPAG